MIGKSMFMGLKRRQELKKQEADRKKRVQESFNRIHSDQLSRPSGFVPIVDNSGWEAPNVPRHHSSFHGGGGDFGGGGASGSWDSSSSSSSSSDSGSCSSSSDSSGGGSCGGDSF